MIQWLEINVTLRNVSGVNIIMCFLIFNFYVILCCLFPGNSVKNPENGERHHARDTYLQPTRGNTCYHNGQSLNCIGQLQRTYHDSSCACRQYMSSGSNACSVIPCHNIRSLKLCIFRRVSQISDMLTAMKCFYL